MKKLLIETSIILLLSLTLAFTFNLLTGSETTFFKKFKPAEIEDYNINEIDTAILIYLFHNEQVILLDARDKTEYDLGHLPEAINFPVSQFEKFYILLYSKLQHGRSIVTYCSSSEYSDSLTLAQLLYQKGYTNIYDFKGGMQEWQSFNNQLQKTSERGQYE